MYVLDANSLVYFFKGMGRVGERLLSTPPREIALPAIVLYELEVGIAKSSSPEKRRVQLADFISVVDVLPFTEAEAKASAKIRAALEKVGRPIGPLDTLIAGTAMSHGATLVTHNVREFGRVEGLTIEDWF